ncbi:immunity 26/phosphotriesterase HocA family protein [Hyalangium versicolor]|uniref:immunity 26/phosphotriesterase HocA family protein n=1 Tax=Hyalangium versicolor TaxID=2861190 RepID=UPI001CCC4C56|nr:immunity 26/phosphotriesterase HocA family protein [Hyalangium versicolor]
MRTDKPGTFLAIPLGDGSFGYGRVLEAPYAAFYDYRTTELDRDLSRIASKPVLFKIAVHHSSADRWKPIGWKEVETHLAQPIVAFTQDIGNLQRCTIFDTAGNERTAEPQECVGLEPAAVWEQHHVEDRLLDTFMGRPNAYVERLSVRLL